MRFSTNMEKIGLPILCSDMERNSDSHSAAKPLMVDGVVGKPSPRIRMLNRFRCGFQAASTAPLALPRPPGCGAPAPAGSRRSPCGCWRPARTTLFCSSRCTASSSSDAVAVKTNSRRCVESGGGWQECLHAHTCKHSCHPHTRARAQS